MPTINLRGKSLGRVIGIVGALAFMLQGYDQAVGNGLLTLQTFITIFPQIDTVNTTGATKSHNATIQGTTIAIYEVGCAIGALACAVVGDILGRKKTIFIAGCVALVGIIIQSSPFALGQLIAGRVITGLGVGGFTATVPMYISESSRAEARGRMVLLEGWFAIGGVALATWIEFGFYYVKNSSVNWRFPIALQAVFALVVVVAIPFMPESPRWLVRQDRLEDASETLSKLEDAPADSFEVTQHLEIIRHSLAEDANAATGAVSNSPFARTKNRHLHRTILAVGVNILAQMTGVNIITFYSDTILQSDLGYSGTLSRIITGCLQLWQVLAAGLAVLLVDRFGRRALLITAAAGMTVAQACLAGLSSDLSNKNAAGASLLFYFIALFCFPIGLFLVPFMYAAEIAPLRVRAKVTAMSAASNWLFNFLIAEVTPVGFANIGWRYYIVYACISAFALVCFTLFYPETRGRTLEEIDEIFEQSNSVFDPVRVARELPFQDQALQAIAGAGHEEKGKVERVEEAAPAAAAAAAAPPAQAVV